MLLERFIEHGQASAEIAQLVAHHETLSDDFIETLSEGAGTFATAFYQSLKISLI